MSYTFRNADRRKLNVLVMLRQMNGEDISVATSVDFSQTGVKLELKSAVSVPKRFLMILSNNHSVQRVCELTWSKGTTIGARFVSGAESTFPK